MLVDLILGGYAYIRHTSGILEAGLRRMPGLGRDTLSMVFATLGGPVLTALEAAALAGSAIRSAALAPIKTTGVDLVTDVAVRSIGARWGLPVAARLVRQHAERELFLLPEYLQTVTRVCTTLAAEGVEPT